jgi:methionyl aminopeptidase
MDASYKENALRAGKIAALALRKGADMVVPGASYHKIYNDIIKFIHEQGAEPAFPPQLSFNEVAAHFLASPNTDITLSNEIVKLDVGVSVDGVIGDNAMTIDLSGKHKKLVDASRSAVEAVREQLSCGMTLHQVGELIEKQITEQGFVPVRNLSGHGLGLNIIHQAPTIPNYGNNDPQMIVPGMHFACEPFATDGTGLIAEVGTAEIFSLVDTSRPVRDKDARNIIQYVAEHYGTLPFSNLDLLPLKIPLFKQKVAMAQLIRAQAIRGYPPLVEQKKGMVSQAEHTFLILEDKSIIATTYLD